MAWKVITFLAIFALSEARPPTSEQKVKIENWLSHIGSQESEYKEVHAYPSYEFTYEVSDPHTHDFKGQHEQRKGDELKGYYWLIQPDGLKRTVKYRADKHSGFNAHVDYNKHWEENNNREEGEGEGLEEANEEENISAENGNEGNGEENENNENENEDEGAEQNENNEAGEGEESQNEERQVENRQRDSGRGDRRYNLRRGNGNEKWNRGELRATVGIWNPKGWSNRQRKEDSRRVEAGQQNNENNEENSGRRENENERGENVEGGAENRRGGLRQRENNRSEVNRGAKRRGNEDRIENRRQESQRNENNENGERNEENQEEQREQGGENGGEEANTENRKGKIIKTEYHVTIHHPKYKIKYQVE